jgi:predicted transport protein
MQLYHNTKNMLSNLKEKPFKLEKDMQSLFEDNLEQITEFKFVKSEFALKNLRLDTLAFNEESKSFVIIEYKRDRNYSVVDQGVSYLNLMLEYKADFIVEYNESCDKNLKRDDVDWSQSKVIFVAPSFTSFQKQSSNFKDLPIELWEIKQFENGIIVINPIKKAQSAPSIKQVQPNATNSEISKVVNEIKIYTEEEHLENKSEEIVELYESFKEAILNLTSDIEVIARKQHIAFKKGRNITDITIQKKGLKMWINLHKGELDDAKQLARDVSTTGHWGNGDYELLITDTQNLEYIMSLVKQAL